MVAVCCILIFVVRFGGKMALTRHTSRSPMSSREKSKDMRSWGWGETKSQGGRSIESKERKAFDQESWEKNNLIKERRHASLKQSGSGSSDSYERYSNSYSIKPTEPYNEAMLKDMSAINLSCERIGDDLNSSGCQRRKESSLSRDRDQAEKRRSATDNIDHILKKRRYDKSERCNSSSSRSTSSSSSESSSSSSGEHEKQRKKERKKQKKEKKKQKKARKREKKLKKRMKKLRKKEVKSFQLSATSEKQAVPLRSSPTPGPGPGPPIPELSERAMAMKPMTKEEWDKRQQVIRKVYDEDTGRLRLIKGDGEVLEEIVSRDRHRQINRQATQGDGNFFQSHLAAKLS